MSNLAGGPVTEEGKEIVRWNATRHGIRSPAPVVPGMERAEDWELHLTGTLKSLSPEGHLEMVLAERVALLSWRLHRVTRYETEAIALLQKAVEEDLAREQRLFAGPYETTHPEDVHWEHEYAKGTLRVLKRLPGLPDDSKLSRQEAGAAIWALTDLLGEENKPEEIEVPGALQPLALQYIFEYDIPWTASSVRTATTTVAKIAGKNAARLLEAAAERARLEVIRTKHAVEELEEDLKDRRRARLLPEERTLEKVARYEAHLSRELFKALHELEALQTRRLGGSAPLARLEVNGLAES
jgi:hypothetical protein